MGYYDSYDKGHHMETATQVKPRLDVLTMIPNPKLARLTSATPPCWIIEGVDRVGKGTLINSINNMLGFHQVIKYGKPEKLACYGGDYKKYQQDSYKTGFSLLGRTINTSSHFVPKVIFDRFHLGEAVYSPMYRGYSGDYVFELEKKFMLDFGGPSSGLFARRVCLVLLVADNVDNLAPDDGLSHDPDQKDLEQSMFVDCFRRSRIPNKVQIQVNETVSGAMRKPMDIFNELLEKSC
jgi:hypothetical protein